MIRLNKSIQSLKPSDTLMINQKSLALQKEGKRIAKFGFGQSPFPVPDCVKEALKSNAFQKEYLPCEGLSTLRSIVGEHFNGLLKSNFGLENIFIGPGSKELIFQTLICLDLPLLLPNPSWVSYGPQAKILNKHIIHVESEMDTFMIGADSLEESIQSNNVSGGVLILNYPNNPTGRTFSSHELSEIARVCRKYHIIVISDEIYGLLTFDGRYESISKYYPEGTIITSGLSKWCGAGGWRLGVMVIPDSMNAIYDMMKVIASETFSAVSAPIQYAAIVAYDFNTEIENYLKNSVYVLQKVAQYCFEKLRIAGVDVLPSMGGFYLFPNFTSVVKEIGSSISFCNELLYNNNVALLPGSSFGRSKSECTTRLSYVDFDGARVLDFVKNGGKINDDNFDQLFPNIVTGMRSICQFIQYPLLSDKL